MTAQNKRHPRKSIAGLLLALVLAVSFFEIHGALAVYYNLGAFWRAPVITLRGCSSGITVNTFGATVTLPTGTQQGDLVVVGLVAGSGATAATGYTQQYSDSAASSLFYLYTHPFLTGDTTSPYFNFFTANSVWIACSYENVGGVESATGADSAGAVTNSIASATGSGLTTTHSSDKLVVFYYGNLFNCGVGCGVSASLIYPGALVEEYAYDASGPTYMWESDETMGGAGTSTGTLTATCNQPVQNMAAQLLLHL